LIFLRSALFNLYFFGLTVLLCLVGWPFSKLFPNRTLLIPRFWARCVLAGLRVICGIRFELYGAEHLPKEGPTLIASRHQSTFDTIVWLTLLPRCCYVIKKELRRLPLFGDMIEPAGMILVDRQGGAAAMRHLMRETERAVAHDRQIVIFPEGTRAEPGHMRPLQPGIIAMALRSGRPVIPVLTDSGRFWGRRAFRKVPGTIHIQMLPPLEPAGGREAFMRRLSETLGADLPHAVDNPVG
jgi:1-acyl-sn-glycerol-3-phosphate acyltransferase